VGRVGEGGGGEVGWLGWGFSGGCGCSGGYKVGACWWVEADGGECVVGGGRWVVGGERGSLWLGGSGLEWGPVGGLGVWRGGGRGRGNGGLGRGGGGGAGGGGGGVGGCA